MLQEVGLQSRLTVIMTQLKMSLLSLTFLRFLAGWKIDLDILGQSNSFHQAVSSPFFPVQLCCNGMQVVRASHTRLIHTWPAYKAQILMINPYSTNVTDTR